MARRRRLRWTLLTMGLGAAAQYFLDPERGNARRAQARDQVQAATRRAQRKAEGEAEYAQERAEGLAYEASHPQAPPDDDRTLVDKVRSEVMGRQEFDAYTVNVDAVEGVVTLRGVLGDAGVIADLEQAVRKVVGVRDVQNFLHTPGTQPPNYTGTAAP
jgi:osmotically-inducible protein OsmY